MGFFTPVGIAPISPPPNLSADRFPIRDWPQSLSFCCWRSRSAPLSSIVIPKSFVAARPVPLRWPGNCASRSPDFRPPALRTLPKYPVAPDRQTLTDPISRRDTLLLPRRLFHLLQFGSQLRFQPHLRPNPAVRICLPPPLSCFTNI